MGIVKKAAFHISIVGKGMIFIGFTIQIALGMFWMCCNFMQRQDFGEPLSPLYRGLVGICAGNARIVYLLQLGLAFYAGCRLLHTLRRRVGAESSGRGGRARIVWGSLALLTFPFAMQCHLSLQPHSLMGSLFVLMLCALVGVPGAVRTRLLAALSCLGLLAALSWGAEGGEGAPRHSFWSAMASRMAWPDIWNDQDRWTEDLQEMAGEVLWEVSHYPVNMDILFRTIEDKAGAEAAEGYYRQIAEVGWGYHSYMVMRQIGWDVLGYALTPVVFGLQLEGEAYDSFTGRNYEIMRRNAPVLTRYYVDYACWWFGAVLVLSFCLVLARLPARGLSGRKGWVFPAAVCFAASAVPVFLLTMRGAGLMDYRYTFAVNGLWLAAGILLLDA